MKHKRKEPIPRLRARCDALWRDVILARGRDVNGGLCLVCESRVAQQAHHVFHKGANSAMRFNVLNGLPLCMGCHLRERYNPTPVVMAALAYNGVAAMRVLWEDAKAGRGGKLWKRVELEAVEIALRALLADSALQKKGASA